ncbi:MAG: hypothetical protein WBV39_00550, partial [Rudaea sp.]
MQIAIIADAYAIAVQATRLDGVIVEPEYIIVSIRGRARRIAVRYCHKEQQRENLSLCTLCPW